MELRAFGSFARVGPADVLERLDFRIFETLRDDAVELVEEPLQQNAPPAIATSRSAARFRAASRSSTRAPATSWWRRSSCPNPRCDAAASENPN